VNPHVRPLGLVQACLLIPRPSRTGIRTVSQTRPTFTHTLGAALERDRLEHRVGRAALAIAMLRRVASEDQREPPRHIRQTIADFEAQTTAMKARLQELADDAGPHPDPDRLPQP
jgi:hypothetical protein